MIYNFILLLVSIVLLAPAKLPVERVDLGASRISLGETTFAEIARRLGSARITHAGDAGESRYQACYRVAGEDAPGYYVESDEMGGGERVTQFEAISRGAASAAEDSLLTGDCSTLSHVPRVQTDRGVRLGLSRTEVERRLGGGGRDSSGVTIYAGSEARRVSDLQATAWSFLRIRYRHARVVAFAAAAGITD